MNLNEIINNPNASIVDVRTPGEFSMGNVAGSVNIPLDQVPHKVEDFKNMSKPIVLCCASGNRSGQATMFLRHNGIEEAYNGGGWSEVQIHKM